MHISAIKRTLACLAIAALLATCFVVSSPRPAMASGCTTPPCGALTNQTHTDILVKWTDDDGKHWEYSIVKPDTTKGGWWNDGIDVDFWYIPAGCTDKGGIGGKSITRTGEQWAKISSTQTVVIKSRTCT